jgi:hypothetical protein
MIAAGEPKARGRPHAAHRMHHALPLLRPPTRPLACAGLELAGSSGSVACLTSLAASSIEICHRSIVAVRSAALRHAISPIN